MARIAMAESENRSTPPAPVIAPPPDAIVLAQCIKETAHLCRVIASVVARFSPSVVLNELTELVDRRTAAIEKALGGEQ